MYYLVFILTTDNDEILSSLKFLYFMKKKHNQSSQNSFNDQTKFSHAEKIVQINKIVVQINQTIVQRK